MPAERKFQLMIIKNANVLNSDFKFVTTDLEIDGGIFKSIGKTDGDGLDLDGKYVVPGLIDIHIHGAMGARCDDKSESSVYTVAEYLLKSGITSFAYTISSRSDDETKRAIENCAAYVKDGEKHAKVAGIHMEGPYLSLAKKGGMNKTRIRRPDIEEFNRYYEASGGLLKLITVAPEVDGAIDFIKEASKLCTVSMGHTDTDYDTAKLAIESGAKHVTHTFNAMRSYGHRDPALLGAAFDTDVMCECISDGYHLSPTTVRMLYRLVGEERLVLISDACFAGLADGKYSSNNHNITVKDGLATKDDGTISGSCFNLLHSTRQAIKFGIPMEHAFKCATINPAKVMKIDDKVGSISEGKCADFLVLDEELNLVSVYKNGELV